MIDLVGKRILFVVLSLIVIVPGLAAIAAGGLKAGIDFTGGKRLTVIPLNAEAYDSDKFRTALDSVGQNEAVIKLGYIGEGSNITNTVTLDLPGIANLPDLEREDAISKVSQALIQSNLVAGNEITETVSIQPTPVAVASGTPAADVTATSEVTATGAVSATAVTTDTTGTTANTTPTEVPATTEAVSRWRIDERSVVDDITVGPVVGQELIGRAFLAILAASAATLIYLTVVFRKVPNAFRYGACAVFAIVHDVLVVVGIFAILGLLFGVEIDSLFITAMMTIIGFSVHDTIVVFDRVRENLAKRKFERFDELVNYSLVQTLARSINTSITVVLTLFALYMFGGTSIHNFVLALLIGIVSGTYSSIFNASMLLVIWENREWGRFFGGKKAEVPVRATR
jgi:preprotein translocase subunit SecF